MDGKGIRGRFLLGRLKGLCSGEIRRLLLVSGSVDVVFRGFLGIQHAYPPVFPNMAC